MRHRVKQLSSNWILAVAAVAAVVMVVTTPLNAEQFEKTKKVGATTVHGWDDDTSVFDPCS